MHVRRALSIRTTTCYYYYLLLLLLQLLLLIPRVSDLATVCKFSAVRFCILVWLKREGKGRNGRWGSKQQIITTTDRNGAPETKIAIQLSKDKQKRYMSRRFSLGSATRSVDENTGMPSVSSANALCRVDAEQAKAHKEKMMDYLHKPGKAGSSVRTGTFSVKSWGEKAKHGDGMRIASSPKENLRTSPLSEIGFYALGSSTASVLMAVSCVRKFRLF